MVHSLSSTGRPLCLPLSICKFVTSSGIFLELLAILQVLRLRILQNCHQRAGSYNISKLLSKRQFRSIFDRSQRFATNLLKMNMLFLRWTLALSREQQNTQMLYNCRGNGVFLEVTLEWIHSIHQNLCTTHWTLVGNNIDSRDNMFVNGYVILSL